MGAWQCLAERVVNLNRRQQLTPDFSALEEGIPCTDTSVLSGEMRVDVENVVRASLENDELIVHFGEGSPTLEHSVRCGKLRI